MINNNMKETYNQIFKILVRNKLKLKKKQSQNNMRALQLHCNSIEYEPTHKEISIAENIDKKRIRVEDIVTLFVSIEKGDNDNTAKQMVTETKESMKKLGVDNLLIYPYAHLS